MPLLYEEMKGNRRARIAVILPDGGQILKDVHFHVTVGRNRGWRMEAFSDEQEAIAWLRYSVPARRPDADNAWRPQSPPPIRFRLNRP